MKERDIGDLDYQQQVKAYTELFDDLNLGKKTHRRTAVWLLDELFRRTLSEIGRDYLGFSSVNRENNVKILWRKTLDRFETFDSFDEPKDYTVYIEQLHDFRNQTAHNTDYNPPQSNLEEIRKDIEGWLDWVLDNAHRYNSDHEQMPPRELMVRMTKRGLDRILSETREDEITDEFEDWQGKIRNDAKELQKEIEALEEEDEISVELIDTLVESIELARDYEQLQKTEAAFWGQIEAKIDEHIQNKDPFV